jgi:hypothetical protein
LKSAVEPVVEKTQELKEDGGNISHSEKASSAQERKDDGK